MQYRARGTYSVGLPFGAGANELNTNSGLPISFMCARKSTFHGASGSDSGEGADAIVRDMSAAREAAREVMLKDG